MQDIIKFTPEKNKTKSAIFIAVKLLLFCSLSYLLMTSGAAIEFEEQHKNPVIIKITCCFISLIVTLLTSWVFYDFTYEPILEEVANKRIKIFLKKNGVKTLENKTLDK